MAFEIKNNVAYIFDDVNLLDKLLDQSLIDHLTLQSLEGKVWVTKRAYDGLMRNGNLIIIEKDSIYLGKNTLPDNGIPGWNREETLDLFGSYMPVQIKFLDAIVETLSRTRGYVKVELTKEDFSGIKDALGIDFQRLLQNYGLGYSVLNRDEKVRVYFGKLNGTQIEAKGAESSVSGLDGVMKFINRRCELMAYFSSHIIPPAASTESLGTLIKFEEKYNQAAGVIRAVYSDRFPQRIDNCEIVPNYDGFDIEIHTSRPREFQLLEKFRENMPYTKMRKLKIISSSEPL